MMDDQIERLGDRILAAYESKTPRRLLVAIAGPPGCGKSTLVDPLVRYIATRMPQSKGVAQVSLDGWHYTRAELDAMSNPEEAHWRRGAAFTFDLARYTETVQRLKEDKPEEPIRYATFDHRLKDPSDSGACVRPSDRIVIIEGLYTLLDRPGWKECAQQMDIRVWIEVDACVAQQRVIARNLEAGICDTLEACTARVIAVDMANGVEVRKHRVPPTDIVYSVDMPILLPLPTMDPSSVTLHNAQQAILRSR